MQEARRLVAVHLKTCWGIRKWAPRGRQEAVLSYLEATLVRRKCSRGWGKGPVDARILASRTSIRAFYSYYLETSENHLERYTP